ncbi:MFS transporter [Rhizobium sp. BR 314]|uniref:MFS transporter n=1 Tax=Rhizobium sp. BR 314 TaxID=3040013 RepID=UPI0039BF246C
MTSPIPALDIGPISKGARSHHPLFAIGAVMIGSYIASFDSRLFSIGLADLKGAFSLSFDEGAWLGTAAFGSQILIAPAVSWLATVFGVRRIFVVPSLLYAAISLIIPFVGDYEALLVLHVIRGLLLGLFVPATVMIIFRNLSMSWWLPAIALYAFRTPFTLNAGVSFGGFYAQTIGWQWMYWQDALVAPLMGIFMYLGAPHERVNRELLFKADWGGMLLFGVGLTLLYVGLDQGNRLNWLESGVVVATLAGGVALILAFFMNESLVHEPWASATVLMSRNISLMLVATIFFTLTCISNTTLVPNFLATVGQLRPEQTGSLLLLYGTLPLFILVPACVFLLRRIDKRFVMMLGFSAFAAASLLGATLSPDWRLDNFIPVVVLQSIGYSFTFLTVIVFAVANLNPARATAFSAYIQVLRLGGTQIGVALMGTYIRVREQVHSNLLGQHLGNGDESVTQSLNAWTSLFSADEMSLGNAKAMSALSSAVQKQAYVLAYIDGFWLTFWVGILGLATIVFMARSPAGPFTPKGTEA